MKSLFLFLFSFLLTSSGFAQTQTITGNIYDDASKAPLTGVVVAVVNSSPALGTVTDANGHFALAGVPLGRQTLKITYISYEDRTISDLLITAGKEVNLNIAMQEAVRSMKEVVFSYDRRRDKDKTINDMALVSSRSFNVDETNRYAGALGDPSRMAANYAGVVSGNDSRNDIVVRGNSPTGMLWQIEGMNAPNPNHFGTINSTGGPVSMLNSNNIDKSDFFTGAFPAQYGNALAGVFDMKLRDGNHDKPEYVAQIGFNGFEGGAEGPIGKNSGTSYLVNFRYSTLAVFKALGLNLGTGTAVPVYEDVNYKVVTKLGKRGKLSLFGIAGDSRVNFLGKDIDTTKPDLYGGDPFRDQRSKFITSITGLAYDQQLSEKSSTRFILGYCTTYQHYTTDSISDRDGTVYPNQYALFKTGKLSLQWSYLHKFSSKNNLQAGVSYENTNYSTNYTKMIPGMPDQVYEDQTGNMGLEQAYVQWKHRFNKSLSFVGGMHFQLLDINKSFSAEPRAAFRYAPDARNAFSLGYGWHSQAQNVYTYFIQTPRATGVAYTNKNLGFTQSQHLVAEYDLNLSKNMRVKIEGYCQYISKVPVTEMASSYSALNSGADFGLDNNDSLLSKGTGRNLGAELTIEHFLSKGFYFLVTGSLVNSKYRGSDGVERNTAFNTGYVANVLAGKEFRLSKNSIFALNAKASMIGGKYLTPINPLASQLAGTEVLMDNLAFSVRQSAYFRTDVKLTYRREFRKSTLEFSIDLENITNHKNVFNQTYDSRKGRIVNNYQQGFFPVPLFRYTF